MNSRESHNESFWVNRRIIGMSTLVLLILAAFLFAQTLVAFKEYRYVGKDTPPTNTITVTGDGEAYAVPDIAEFTFSIIKEGDSPNAVREQADEVFAQALSYVEDQGVEEKDVKAISYQINPRYEYNQSADCLRGGPCSGERVLVGFELNQTVRVKVRDVTKAGDIIAGLANMDVESVSGLAFTIDDEDMLRAEARRMAIEEARAQAKVLAQQLDGSLGRVVNFNEFGGGGEPPIAYRTFAEDSAQGGAVAPQAAPLPAGENRVSSTVSITYEIL